MSLENGMTTQPRLIRARVVHFMNETSGRQFGLLIAYVLPGFIALMGLSPIIPALGAWLTPIDHNDLSIGPPVYTVMAATAMGLMLAALRWLILDHLHAWTGIARPELKDKRLDDVLGGFDYLVQNHFRYYEFFGNTLMAAVAVYSANRLLGTFPFLGIGTDLGMVILCLVLFAASRDTLAQYFKRTGRLVGRAAEKGGINHEHDQ